MERTRVFERTGFAEYIYVLKSEKYEGRIGNTSFPGLAPTMSVGFIVRRP